MLALRLVFEGGDFSRPVTVASIGSETTLSITPDRETAPFLYINAQRRIGSCFAFSERSSRQERAVSVRFRAEDEHVRTGL